MRERRTATSLLLAGVIGVALGLRLTHYCGRPSLWIDEARLALNIGSRTYAGLLHPLDYDQVASVLFLWVEKLIAQVFGLHELALRFLPLVAGIAAVPLTYAVARRLLGDRAALLAAAMAAISPALVLYSNELKPYSLDQLTTLLMLWFAIEYIQKSSSRSLGWLLGAGIVAVWASLPAIFVLAGILTALVVAHQGSWTRRLGPLAVLSAGWGTSFLTAYLIVYRQSAANPYLKHFWGANLLDPGRPRLGWRVAQSLQETIFGLLAGIAADPPLTTAQSAAMGGAVILLIGLAVSGALWTVRQNGRWSAMLLAGPLLVVLVASAVRAYPIAVRVMLFAAPLLQILVAAGLRQLSGNAASRWRRLAVGGVAGCLLLAPLPRTLGLAARPLGSEHLRPAIQMFQQEAEPTEPVYLSSGSLPAWMFYVTDWSSPDLRHLGYVSRVASSGGPAFENAPPRGHVVVEEGKSLVSDHRGRREIIGLPTGMEWLSGTQLSRIVPDSGWLLNEAARIKAEARPDVWVVFSHFYGPEVRLLSQLEVLGGRRLSLFADNGVVLAEVRFEN